MVPLALLFSRAFADDCPADAVGEVERAATGMEIAAIALDDAGFMAWRAVFDATLPCVREPLLVDDVARIHRAKALGLFVDAEMTAAMRSWGAVKRLTPEWRPNETLAPPGHLIERLFEEASTDDDRVELELAPVGGWLINAEPSSSIPTKQAFVLQALDEDGVVYTGYHFGLAEIPMRDLVRLGPSPRAKKVRLYGSIGAGALLAGAGAATAVHLRARDQVDEVPYNEIDEVALRRDVAGGSAIALGVLGATAFTLAWAIPW